MEYLLCMEEIKSSFYNTYSSVKPSSGIGNGDISDFFAGARYSSRISSKILKFCKFLHFHVC